MDLIFATQSYPYYKAGEQTFINQEIPFLLKAFDKIYIIPKEVGGEKEELLSEQIVIIEEYAKNKSKLNKRKVIAKLPIYGSQIWSILIKEIIGDPGILFNAKKTFIMLNSIFQSNEFYFFIRQLIEFKGIDVTKTIFYTFWFQQTTTGMVLLKRDYSKITVVTRAHNIDLFKERHRFGYIPFRKTIIKKINGIFPCMQTGTEYIRDNYKLSNSVLETSYLGVDEPAFVNLGSSDGVFRILSCSSIIAVKRLNLLVEGLVELVKIIPNIKIEWTHFGDGVLRDEIFLLSDKLKNEYVSVIFKGHMSFDMIMTYYRISSVDVFINVSSFEGQPVSIKEAISVGIPIIATNVGGNSEIVSKSNGLLLSADPNPLEIANAIKWFIENKDVCEEMRQNSRKLYFEKYDSKKVYPDFINKIKGLIY